MLQKKVAGVSEKALARFVLRARRAAALAGRVNVLVTSNAAMRSLNFRFRGKNRATDVLSFPAEPSGRSRGNKKAFAGEIAISGDIAGENALRFGHLPAQEIKVLALHGILHLAGFDHERDNGEMASKEAALRHALRLPSTLIDRTQSHDRRAAKMPPRRSGLRTA